LLIVKNEAFDLSQIMRSYASVACKKNGRLQPEFAVSVRRPDLDMRRLASLVGIEMKTKRSDAQNGWHLSTIPHATWIAWKYFFAERCLVTQNSNLTIKARKKWTIRVGVAELES